MPIIEDTEPVRGYELPNELNKLKDDVYRLRAALAAIGVDVGDVLAALALKAALVHQHAMSDITGLADALAAKADAGGSIALDDLSDVDAGAAAAGQFLMKSGTGWIPAAILLANVTGWEDTVNALIATAIASKAPLASPAFTGNPTAPTQAVGNNSTRLATTAFVTAAINALVAAAPGALDTLNELAAAMGDDPNFATTVTNALAACVKLATDGVLAAGYRSTSVSDGNSGTAAYTSTYAGGNIRTRNNSGAHVWNAPSAAGVYTILTEVINVAGAGAITMTGFTKVTGDPFTTTVGDKFVVFIAKTNASTHAAVVALQ